MRELHGYHGEHRRHAHDARAPADNPATPARDAHDASGAPRLTVHDLLKHSLSLGAEGRKERSLAYRQQAEADEAAYAARHAKPDPADQARTPDRLKPQEPRPKHEAPESSDKPAGKIADREKPLGRQGEERQVPERSRLPRTETVQMLAGNGLAVATIAVTLNLMPDSWEKLATSIAAAVIGNVAWGNKRWKDKHGNRPED